MNLFRYHGYKDCLPIYESNCSVIGIDIELGVFQIFSILESNSFLLMSPDIEDVPQLHRHLNRYLALSF